MIVQGSIQILSGLAAMSAAGGILFLFFRILITRRGRRAERTEKVVAFIAAAYVVAVVAGRVAAAMAPPEAAGRGVPGVWMLLAILFGFLWYVLRRERMAQQARNAKASEPATP